MRLNGSRIALLAAGAVAAACSRTKEKTASGSLDIYSATRAGALSPVAAKARPMVYVPNSRSASVTEIDPLTYRVVRTFKTGRVPQHVVPSYDLSRLWVLNNESSTLTPIDPVTGGDGAPVQVD
ncbi:MAG: YncE family protein, partial [Solirubrobacteraceae bacterium]